jgi:hypothetical protein
MELTSQFREKFVKKLQGKNFILYGGLLELAHQKRLKSLEVEIVQIPSQENSYYAVCKATARDEEGAVYTEVGDACPTNVNLNIVPHILRMAATRAKARALRDFTGIDMVAVDEICEELPEAVGDTPKPEKKAAQSDGEMACWDCRSAITTGIYRVSVRKYGRPLCLGCQGKARGQGRVSK